MLVRFTYSSIPVGFRVISISYPEESLRPEVILCINYLRKCSIWLAPPPIISLSSFKNAIKSELLGVRDWYLQDFHISMIPTTGKNFKKIHAVMVTFPRWLNIELLASWSNCITFFFYFCHYLPYTRWVDVIYLTCLVFLNTPLVSIFCAPTSLTQKMRLRK